LLNKFISALVGGFFGLLCTVALELTERVKAT
jgi:hypothetical protein